MTNKTTEEAAEEYVRSRIYINETLREDDIITFTAGSESRQPEIDRLQAECERYKIALEKIIKVNSLYYDTDISRMKDLATEALQSPTK